MNKDTMHKLASQLIVCQDEQKKLRDENERLRDEKGMHDQNERLHDENKRLRTQIADMKQHAKIAIENAYEEGYKACQRDTQQGKQQ